MGRIPIWFSNRRAEGTTTPLAKNYNLGLQHSQKLPNFHGSDLSCYDSSTNESLSCMAKGNNSNYRIDATKTLLFANNLGAETKPNLEMIKQTRKVIGNANKGYFNGTKLAFTIALMIAAVLLMADVEVFGFLHVIGAKLNSLSLVNLGIVIGMSSEFTYLARCFLAIDGTKNERVRKALESTLEPLLHGLGTQIAATFPLIFLKYHAFRVYYFAMFTLMGMLGFINGFVFFPVLLSMLDRHRYYRGRDKCR